MNMDLSHINWEAVLAFVSIGVIIIGFVSWFIRVEMKIEFLERHNTQDINIWQKIEAIQNSMSVVEKTVARIEGRLENN